MSVRTQTWILESLWLAFAALLAAALTLPALFRVGGYHYLPEIAGCAFAFVTLGRLVFFSEQAPWMRPRFTKGVVPIACIPLILFAVLTLNNVQNLVDAEGADALFFAARGPSALRWATYLRDMAVFVCAGTVVAAVVLPIVLLVRLWRQVKTQLRAGQRHPTQP